MENSFLYSKYIYFLAGRTYSALSLSLSVPLPSGPCEPLRPTGLPPPLYVVGPMHQGKNPQSPAHVPCSGHHPSASILAPTPRHPSLTAGLPLELVVRRRHVMAACAAGLRPSVVPCRRDAQRPSLRANPRSTGRLPRLGIVGLPLPLPSART
jgi:hypothetical protein